MCALTHLNKKKKEDKKVENQKKIYKNKECGTPSTDKNFIIVGTERW